MALSKRAFFFFRGMASSRMTISRRCNTSHQLPPSSAISRAANPVWLFPRFRPSTLRCCSVWHLSSPTPSFPMNHLVRFIYPPTLGHRLSTTAFHHAQHYLVFRPIIIWPIMFLPMFPVSDGATCSNTDSMQMFTIQPTGFAQFSDWNNSKVSFLSSYLTVFNSHWSWDDTIIASIPDDTRFVFDTCVVGPYPIS